MVINMENNLFFENIDKTLLSLLCRKPQAYAEIRGSEEYKSISGILKLYRTANGVLIYAAVTGLPHDSSFHGFHIHSGEKCSGSNDDPFSDAKSHYNPTDTAHPNHSGDFPPLISSNGNALSVFITNRFAVNEVLQKTVIIHEKADDFTTQPSGNSGKKIACGKIVSI